ncbi:MAG: nucleotide exchange factor GrpE [Chloroflexi bacterium]|nr:nucleotide exchange factor GrpE [Chloroflexota bacterium]
MTEQKEPEDLGPPEDELSTSDGEDMTLMREQLEEALREKDQFRAMSQRAQADLYNFKTRAAQEQESLRLNANSQILLKILSALDDLERALRLVPEDAVATGWLEGLQWVQRNIESVLNSEGVTKIEAQSRVFEPWEHEAVFYEETPDSQEGIVIKVVRDGYKLHDKVLRAAQVIVSKSPEPQDQSETTHQEA